MKSELIDAAFRIITKNNPEMRVDLFSVETNLTPDGVEVLLFDLFYGECLSFLVSKKEINEYMKKNG